MPRPPGRLVKGNAVLIPASLRPAVEHLEHCYPHEGCGVILSGAGGQRVQPIDNVYDRLRQADPARYPRSSRSAFELDPGQWLKVCLEAEGTGERIAGVYHSHCDCGAYFSDEDRAWAAPEGVLLLPGTLYLVVAVEGGRVTQFRTYRWRDGVFGEAEVEPW